MSELAIEEAIGHVRAGHVEHYRTVVAAFHQRLLTSIAGLCPPEVDSGEIAHLAFLHAYQHLNEYRSNTNFFAWLSAIARNLLRAECVRQQRRAAKENNYLEHLLIQRFANAAGEDCEITETLVRLLAECLAELESQAQTMIAWRYRDGLQVQAIAERMTRSASAVSVHLFGLRKLLRNCVTRKQAQGAHPF